MLILHPGTERWTEHQFEEAISLVASIYYRVYAESLRTVSDGGSNGMTGMRFGRQSTAQDGGNGGISSIHFHTSRSHSKRLSCRMHDIASVSCTSVSWKRLGQHDLTLQPRTEVSLRADFAISNGSLRALLYTSVASTRVESRWPGHLQACSSVACHPLSAKWR